MKKHGYLLIILLAGAIFTACKKNDMPHRRDYNSSYQAWLGFKASADNSYRYMRTVSSWVGTSMETTITVKRGRVMQRDFVMKDIDPATRQVVVRETWSEDVSALNSHRNGSPAVTLDEIYRQAKTEWLLKRKDARTFFEAENSGMISTCGFVPNGCADDCFNGVHIRFIQKL